MRAVSVLGHYYFEWGGRVVASAKRKAQAQILDMLQT